MEGANARNLKATIVFIDFKKSFDGGHLGLFMKSMNTSIKAKVVTDDGTTEIFDILAGVLQGETLAPYFIIVIDYIMTVTINDDFNTRTLKPSWLNAYFWNISFKNMLHSD